MAKIELPEILNVPPKFLPFILNFKNYRYFLLEGGRASGKTETAARTLLYLAEQYYLRILCGREIQNKIDESVHAELKKLILRYNLDFEITKTSIKHRKTGSEFLFKGFREIGKTNIKGTADIDILWIDEAEQITGETLKVILPTIIRKNKAKLIFTMNRYTRDDAVPKTLLNFDDCLHIYTTYLDNPFISNAVIKAANECKERDIEEYNHIWLGQPLAQDADYLINSDRIYASNNIPLTATYPYNQRVIGFDFAAQGGDFCVATILNRLSPLQWEVIEQRAWKDPIATQSIGRIVEIMGEIRPDAACIDVGGMGYVVHSRLMELGINIAAFDGASTGNINAGVFGNKRAQAYHELRDIIHADNLLIPDKFVKLREQLGRIRYNVRSSGIRFIQRKEEMKKEIGHSPDEADSLMMAVWCTNHHLDGGASMIHGSKIIRKSKIVKR